MRSAVVASLVSVAAASSGWGPGSPEGPAGGPPAYGPPGGSWGPNGGDSWTTEIVSQFTTFCPEATQITHGGQTYTATSATTFTITNCPGGCTISYPTTWAATTTPVETSPVETSPVETSPVETTPAVPTTWAETTTPVAPTTWETTTSPAAPITPTPYPVANATTPVVPAPVGSTASAWPSNSVTPATGGASQLSAAGAAIAAVFGLVAAL